MKKSVIPADWYELFGCEDVKGGVPVWNIEKSTRPLVFTPQRSILFDTFLYLCSINNLNQMIILIFLYIKHDMHRGQCENIIGLNTPPTGAKRTVELSGLTGKVRPHTGKKIAYIMMEESERHWRLIFQGSRPRAFDHKTTYCSLVLLLSSTD